VNDQAHFHHDKGANINECVDEDHENYTENNCSESDEYYYNNSKEYNFIKKSNDSN